MTLRERIADWLLGDRLTLMDLAIQGQDRKARAHGEYVLEVQQEMDQKLEALRLDFSQKLSDQKSGYEKHIGNVLDAALTAADQLARQAAASGDSNLKEYVDACFGDLTKISEQSAWN